MRNYVLCLVCVLLVGPAFAQAPKPLVISSDTLRTFAIDTTYQQGLAEGDGKRKFNEVVHAAAFSSDRRRYTDSNGKFGAITWIRFRLQNRLNHDVKLVMQAIADRLDVYSGQNGRRWQHQVTGKYVPWSQRDGFRREIVLPVTAPPGDTWVYMRVQTDKKPAKVVVAAEREDSYLMRMYGMVHSPDNTIMAAFFGMLLLAAIFNFFFYFLVRERVYGIYGLTLLLAALTFYTSAIDSVARQLPKYEEDLHGTLLALTIFFATYTIRYFLDTRTWFPRWDKVVRATNWICISVIVFFGWLGISFNFPVQMIALVILLVQLTVTPLLFTRRKYKHAHMAVLAFAPIVVYLLYIIVVIISPKLAVGRVIFFGLLFVVIWLIVVLSMALFVRFKQLIEERNALVAAQKARLEQEVADRTRELKESLDHLKATQNQLIHAEKMASLGELTAGIAHEIQNPLNFVNNFAEVSRELLVDLRGELDAGNVDDVRDIADDLDQNLGKINHHGKRADNIVKGMLQHSRSGGGQKELTDVTALADEYLKLSYHGLRAKDKLFNASFELLKDDEVPKAEVQPQEFGRVLLNLFNNAFYAVAKKKLSAPATYDPKVTVTIRREADTMAITVEDNGTGIPEALRDKIMQPFFTTKPTGEGTGLGLSLSYDIVTKVHGGTLSVESREGEFTRFVITIPLPARP